MRCGLDRQLVVGVWGIGKRCGLVLGLLYGVRVECGTEFGGAFYPIQGACHQVT